MPVIASFFFPTLLGADSFYFFVFSCGQEGLPDASIPIASKVFFELLPCNMILFKSISFFILFLSSIIVAKTGELFDKQYGWLAGVFVFFSIAWIHFHIQIEDDLLGYPILFFANYLFLKEKGKHNWNRILAIVLAVLTGLLFWKGALLYLVIYTLFSIVALIVLYASLFYIGFGSMQGLLGNTSALENANVFLLSLLGGRTIGLGHGFGLLGLYVLSRRMWLALPFLVAMLLNFKWAVHLSPFLGLGIMFLITDLNNYRLRKGIVFKEWFANKWFVEIFVVFAVVFVFFLSLGLLGQSPYPAQLEAVEFAVQQSGGELMDNDWSYGYYILFFDGNTATYAGGHPRYTESWNNSVLLTENPEPNEDCELLRTWEKGGFYGSDIKVYDCPLTEPE